MVLLAIPLKAEVNVSALFQKATKHQLKNGLTVILMERHTSPTVSFVMGFKVGSANEDYSKSGLAHVLEHVAFLGTKEIGTTNYDEEQTVVDELDRRYKELKHLQYGPTANQPDVKQKISKLLEKVVTLKKEAQKFFIPEELAKIYEANGSSGLNAYTSSDSTVYTVSLPSNRVPVWMALESDRLQNLAFRNVYSEIDVVKEERRMRIDKQPSGNLMEEFLTVAFESGPYGKSSTIGWMEDLDKITRDDIQTFYHNYYTMDNMTIGIVGDFKTSQMMKWLNTYFGHIQTSHKKEFSPPNEVESRGERRVLLEMDAEPMLFVGYHRPSGSHDDDNALAILSAALTSGKNSVLEDALVTKARLAASVDSSSIFPGSRYSSLFVFVMEPMPGVPILDLEEAFYHEIETIKKDGISEQRLMQIKNRISTDIVVGFKDNMTMAEALVSNENEYGNYAHTVKQLRMIQQLTADDLRRMMNRYFVKKNRVVGSIVKTGVSHE